MNDSNRTGTAFDEQLRQALRSLPDGEPPLGFARGVAAAVEGKGESTHGERVWWLLPTLVFLPAAAFSALRYGDAWKAGFGTLEELAGGAGGLGWIAALGACLALSALLSRLRTNP